MPRKRLESTEHRLIRYPEQAEAYDKQITGIENVGFAKRLSTDEIESHKGSVHYVAHHAVVRPDRKLRLFV